MKRNSLILSTCSPVLMSSTERAINTKQKSCVDNVIPGICTRNKKSFSSGIADTKILQFNYAVIIQGPKQLVRH